MYCPKCYNKDKFQFKINNASKYVYCKKCLHIIRTKDTFNDLYIDEINMVGDSIKNLLNTPAFANFYNNTDTTMYYRLFKQEVSELNLMIKENNQSTIFNKKYNEKAKEIAAILMLFIFHTEENKTEKIWSNQSEESVQSDIYT
jgi:hypothetical protein